MSNKLLQGRYLLQEKLQERDGQSTYRAWDQNTDTPVIVKVLNLSQMENWQALDYFEREIQTLANLSHPAIPKLLDHFKDNDQYYYLVQEAIDAQPLRERFEQGVISEEEALELAEQVLNILDYLQSLNPVVIHRDIKPENLLQDASGTIYLIDFGAVRDAARQQQMSVAGTFGYMAPEQAAGQVQPASDLYALGVTLIEGLSHTAPQDLPQDRDLRFLFHDRIKISERFERWLDLLVDPVVTQRPQNAKEALDWLKTDALSETVGRLEVSFPEQNQTQFTISPMKEKRSLFKLIFLSLKHQAAKIFAGLFVLWFGMVLIINSLFQPGNREAAMELAKRANTVLQLLGLAWTSWIARVEYLALKKEQEQKLVFTLVYSDLVYGEQKYALDTLSQISFGEIFDLKGPERTKIYFKFNKTSLRLPVALTIPEQKLFVHALNQHAQKQLSESAFQQFKQMPQLH